MSLPSGSAGKASETKKKDKHPLPPASLAATIANFKCTVDLKKKTRKYYEHFPNVFCADVLDPTNCMMDDKDTNHSSKVLEQIRSFPKLTGKWTGFSSANNAMRYNHVQ